jgi:hypothetical protein
LSFIDNILAAALPGPIKTAFGDAVTYTHKSGGSEAVTVIPSTGEQLEEGFPGAHMFFEVVTSELSVAPRAGDSIVYQGVTYRAVTVESDGLFSLIGCKQ